jgi:hypothetical protein
MAVTTFPLIARSRTVFPRLGPSTGPVIHQFPSTDRHRPLTAPRRPGVGSPTSPERQGAHYASPDPSSGSAFDPSNNALLERAVDAALESLNRLERQAREVARWFRTSAYTEALDGLRDLIAGTERITTLAAASVDASGTDLTTFCETRGLPAETETASLMNELLRHQRADDRLALAVTLERRFVAALENWRQLFFALGESPTDPSGHAA